jgi:hypothetical protein
MGIWWMGFGEGEKSGLSAGEWQAVWHVIFKSADGFPDSVIIG